MGKDTIVLDKVGLGEIGLVGGKAASLGEMIAQLSQAGVPVPPGFAVTAIAYDQTLDQGNDHSRVRDRLGEVSLTTDGLLAALQVVDAAEARPTPHN